MRKTRGIENTESSQASSGQEAYVLGMYVLYAGYVGFAWCARVFVIVPLDEENRLYGLRPVAFLHYLQFCNSLYKQGPRALTCCAVQRPVTLRKSLLMACHGSKGATALAVTLLHNLWLIQSEHFHHFQGCKSRDLHRPYQVDIYQVYGGHAN